MPAKSTVLSATAVCERCAVEFQPKSDANRRFCTKGCANRRSHDRVAQLARGTCGCCGKQFSWTDHPSRPRQFCSPRCASDALRTYPAAAPACLNCGGPARDKRIRGRNAQERRYCSMACRKAAADRKGERACSACGKTFRTRVYKAGLLRRRFFCSRACLYSQPVSRAAQRIRRTLAENKRRALQQAVPIDTVDYAEIERRDKWRCWLCRKRIQRGDLHFDHVVPLYAGGEHSTRNVRMTHKTCNLRKGKKLITHQPFLV